MINACIAAKGSATTNDLKKLENFIHLAIRRTVSRAGNCL